MARLLRIDHLIVELKRRVDDGEIDIYPAVSLSYLAENEQSFVEEALSNHEFKVDMKKAELLRIYAGKFTAEQTDKILSGEATRKPRSKSPAPFKFKPKIHTKYFPANTKPAEVEAIID
jgi:ParB family chromosome partitioning protein